nr:hypothetical protein [Lacticaseibacillus rhamnosus]
MSDETKREVFDELLKMFRNSMALTHEEPVILDNDGYDVFGKIEKRYATALPDETEKQKNCPYCHEPHKLIESELGNFLRIGMTGGNEWDRIEPKKINGAAMHTCEAVGFDNAEVDDPIVINYCPMCGRRLEGKQ